MLNYSILNLREYGPYLTPISINDQNLISPDREQPQNHAHGHIKYLKYPTLKKIKTAPSLQ